MPFLGMRGTGDWADNQRPESWRELILYLYPNGTAPLTAIMSMMGSEEVSDPRFHWWSKKLPNQGGPAAGVFTNQALSTAYTSGGEQGDTLYVKAAEAVVKEFKIGHTARLGKTGDYRYNTVAKVTGRSLAGANSYLQVVLLQDASSTYDIDEVDIVHVAGSMYPEGDTIPEALSYDPVQFTNVTQIFRTSLSITRTARKTRLRTGDAYKELKREALELHSVEIEKALISGRLYEGIGHNDKPERAMDGLINIVNNHAPDNISNFALEDDYAGEPWIEAGEHWLDTMFERIFRYGDQEKLALVGSGALLAINRLVKAAGSYDLQPKTVSYGIKVTELITPFGSTYLKTHPLFSHDPVTRNDMLIVEPRRLKTRVIDDTFFKSDNSERENTNNSRDATEEEFLTEIGLEYQHPETFGYLTGLGVDNSLTP